MPAAIPHAIPRTALVTGGARRLGGAIVLALADAGFSVAIHCRNSVTEAEALAGEVEARGVRAAIVRADLGDETAVQGLLPAAAGALGPIGVLVNNASAFERDEWDDVTRASWDEHMEPNLRAPFVLMQEMARALPEAASGVVINMIDQRVWSLTPHFISYTVSKAALWALTQQMALALAPRIQVNAIGPGSIMTDILKAVATDKEAKRRLLSRTPLGRIGEPDEIAAIAVFLASDDASYVTGQTIYADGGRLGLNYTVPVADAALD